MKFYVPAWNGDHRLETVEEGKTCRLTIIKPTAAEKSNILVPFTKKLAKKGWVKSEDLPDGDGEVMIEAPLGKVAPILVKLSRPKRTTITAVRYTNGRLEVVEGTGTELAKLGEKLDEQERRAKARGEAGIEGGAGGGAKEIAGGEAAVTGAKAPKVEKVEAERVVEPPKKEPAPAAATSVQRPTPSCPQCIPGSVAPASEVLLAFLSPEEHDRWARERVIEVTGGLTGHRYLISHRHGKWGNRWGRITFDADDQGVLHFHDWSVPPEEEVLAAKLILETREPWLRNEATCLGMAIPVAEATGGFPMPLRNRFRDVFKNPFGDGMDGVADAAFTRMFGDLAKVVSDVLDLK